MTLPQGTYRGLALGWARPFNLVWSGKVFRDRHVKNLILGMELIEGRVYQGSHPGMVVIWYRWLRLRDILTPNGSGYDGTMQLGPIAVRFTLT